MKLTVLLDNNTIIDRFFYGEPGVSYFIQDGDKKILFDVGYSDAFIINAQKMNIRLWDVDFVILSHGHLDHTWGLTSLIKLYTEVSVEKIKCSKPTILTHPFTFFSKKIKGIREIGSVVSEEKLSKHFNVKLSKEPVWLTDKLVFLGEIERKNEFEAKKPLGKIIKNNSEEDDYLMDDSALAYISSEGLVIITGCAHAGICNTVEYAKKICGNERITDIVGGFHLLNPSKEQLQGTLEYMKNLQPHEVHACHCTDLKSKIELSKVADIKEVGVGLKIEYK